MRFRGKMTAAGALAVSAGAVVGGMLVTSNAMAATPAATKGTVTIVSMKAGDDQPVTCTYDDVDLPAPSAADGLRVGTGPSLEKGSAGDGPTFTSVQPDPSRPKLVQSVGRVTAGTAAGGSATGGVVDPSAHGAGDGPVTAAFGPGSSGARQGTAEECAALKATIPAP